MAKYSTAKNKKHTPAVRYLRYELANSGSAGTETSHYIDLAKDLSAINRRLMRQGRCYHIRRVTVVSSNTPNQDNRISISTIPDSWVARNAWRRGFETWRTMRKESSKALGNVAGTWDDFKVYLSNDMRSGSILTPKDNGGNDVSAGEWTYSKLVTPDGTTSADLFWCHMLGDHSGSVGAWNSVGLIKSYEASRPTVQDSNSPNVPAAASDDPLVNVFDYGTGIDEVIDLMESEADAPPYDADDYPGSDGNMPKPIVVQDGTLQDGRCVLGGFSAMAGLLELETKSPLENDVYSVLVELAPGNYRGISADVI